MLKEGSEGLVTAVTDVFTLLRVEGEMLGPPKVFGWSLHF